MGGSGISWAICKSAPRSRQITTPAPHHSVFYRPDALPATQPTAQRQSTTTTTICHRRTGIGGGHIISLSPGQYLVMSVWSSSITIKALDSQLEGVHITIPTLTISLLRKIKMPNKRNCFSILFISSKHYNIHFLVVGCMR